MSGKLVSHKYDGQVLPRVKNPVVLVHGLMGFRALGVAGVTVKTYFPGLAKGLESANNRVFTAELSPTDGVLKRAQELKDYLQHHTNEPVHLFAHSMGGLDARYMISRLGMADRVLTLTTIGTPHRGTSFADWGIQRLAHFVRPMFHMVEIPYQAFYDLTTDSCQKFNEEVTDAPGVRYFSIGGHCEGAWLGPEWRIPHKVVHQFEGTNDGVVSLNSAKWGESFDIWEGDHLSLANWRNVWATARGVWRSRIGEYHNLVAKLEAMGY